MTKLIITPYGPEGQILSRGKTSVKEDATQEEVDAKIQHAFIRAGIKRTVKVEVTKDGVIIQTKEITPEDISSAEQQALAAEEEKKSNAAVVTEESAEMAKNGKATKTRKEKKQRAPGVIAAIVDAMSRSSGASLPETVGILTKKFPNRKAKSMTSTAKIQLNRNATSKDKDDKRGLVYYKKR